MPLMHLVCDLCGTQYSSYQKGKHYHYCSIECRRLDGKRVASTFTKEFREQKSKQFTEMNRTLMVKPEYVEKRRQSLINKRGISNRYMKYYGRHEHRVVAEKKLGRKLVKGEIVHHVDGNKSNNDPDNLMVMTQSEHIKLHLREGGGRLC